ncbi:MAG TPA: type II toxin-antitoxin system death-on-curing family toxin [Chloroflexota bacterium]|nr:type II toxin-antitoxin system death-on-curing family toxin [Chloroflexota bacterium]
MEEASLAYPSLDDALALHAIVMGIAAERAMGHVRDLNLLESALARPRNEAAYEDASLLRQAASLLWGVVKNHPFVDGNKRTGYVLMETFLDVNGVVVLATEDAKFELVVAVAGTHDFAIDDVEHWLTGHTS